MATSPIQVFVGEREFTDFEAAADDILKSLAAAPDRAAKRVSQDLMKALQRVAKGLADKHGTPWTPGEQTGDTLHARSGKGMASIAQSIRVSGSTLDALTGSIDTGDMTIHETGGTITARNSKYLAIPLPDALDARGLPIMPSARDWPGTFVQRSRAGNLIIFQRKGRRIIPLYVLKPSVTIRPRLRMEEAVQGEMPWFQERLIDALVKEFEA